MRIGDTPSFQLSPDDFAWNKHDRAELRRILKNLDDAFKNIYFVRSSDVLKAAVQSYKEDIGAIKGLIQKLPQDIQQQVAYLTEHLDEYLEDALHPMFNDGNLRIKHIHEHLHGLLDRFTKI